MHILVRRGFCTIILLIIIITSWQTQKPHLNFKQWRQKYNLVIELKWPQKHAYLTTFGSKIWAILVEPWIYVFFSNCFLVQAVRRWWRNVQYDVSVGWMDSILYGILPYPNFWHTMTQHTNVYVYLWFASGNCDERSHNNNEYDESVVWCSNYIHHEENVLFLWIE